MSKKEQFVSEFSIEDLTSPHQVKFYKYWQQLKGERTMPARADINPRDFVSTLPFVILCECSDGDYIIKIMGTKCAEVLGEATGLKISSSKGGKEAVDRFNWVVENKKPYFNIKPLDGFDKNHLNASAIVMPLSSNDNDVDMIILIHHFY
ncbi:MAG: PAS domain-containing protein [Emcibacteraceae bacterium]|nr:PAS domain-containing protein [Emcibacteraceae bacterium]